MLPQIAPIAVEYHRSAPINQSLLTYSLIHDREIAVDKVWTVLASEQYLEHKWQLRLCNPTCRRCWRVQVADLIKICPALAEIDQKEILVFVYSRNTWGTLPETGEAVITLQPWIQKIALTPKEHTMFLSTIAATPLDQIEMVLIELRNLTRETEYEDQTEKRLDIRRIFSSCIVQDTSCRYHKHVQPSEIDALCRIWKQSCLTGADEYQRIRLQFVIYRLLLNYQYCAITFRVLVTRYPEMLTRVSADHLRGCLILMLAMENQDLHTLTTKSPCVFTLEQAGLAATAVELLPPGCFDLTQYRFTRHLLRAIPTLSLDLALFRKRLNVFLTGDAEINPLQDVNWEPMAVSGSAMAWMLPARSMRGDLTKQEEMQELYSSADLDLPCHAASMEEFLDHVHQTIKLIDRNLDHTVVGGGTIGGYQMQRSAKIYVCDGDFDGERHNDRRYVNYYQMMCQNARTTHRKDAHQELDLAFLDVPEDQIAVTVVHISEDDLSDLFSWSHRSAAEIEQPCRPSRWVHYMDTSNHRGGAVACPIYISQLVKIRYTNDRLIRPIEFFLTHKNLIAHVSGYHFECVRAMYDGNQVYLTTAAMIAHHTGQVFTPWGRQTSDYPEIVTKYANRGFQVNYGTDLAHPDALRTGNCPLAIDNKTLLLQECQLVSQC